jgi:hypothetical protein
MNTGSLSNRKKRPDSLSGNPGNFPGRGRPTVKQEEFDYFFKTIQSRGFANKMTPQMVQLRAKIYDYTTIC